MSPRSENAGKPAVFPSRSNRQIIVEKQNGAQEWNRTTDTAIFSRMLYQLSYLGPSAVAGETGPVAEEAGDIRKAWACPPTPGCLRHTSASSSSVGFTGIA